MSVAAPTKLAVLLFVSMSTMMQLCINAQQMRSLAVSKSVHVSSDSIAEINNQVASSDFKSANGGDSSVAAEYILTVETQQSYLVGLRFNSTGDNYCFGVLIAPKYVLTSGIMFKQVKANLTPAPAQITHAVVGSRYNSGSHNDGSETIKIVNYWQSPYYLNTGYRDVSIYVLEKRSTKHPVQLPVNDTDNNPEGTTVTTFGWSKPVNSRSSMISMRNLDIVATNRCKNYNIGFNPCICGVTWLANGTCNIPQGSPVITQANGKDVVLSLAYNSMAEGCDESGYPIAFSRFVGILNQIRWTAGLLTGYAGFGE